MATYEIRISKDGIREDTLVKRLREIYGEASITVQKIEKIESRSDRLSVAESSVDDAKNTVEELRDELQNWKDSLPENLQNGQKSDELDEAISQLESLQSELEALDFSSVSFPGMF